mmetsp:Transcript_25071/g.40474  ORF Transcript_25071/g.40474 Transcript_25071/m.40474 type:complete len:713 (+) Transcript_25071:287-2425(+)
MASKIEKNSDKARDGEANWEGSAGHPQNKVTGAKTTTARNDIIATENVDSGTKCDKKKQENAKSTRIDPKLEGRDTIRETKTSRVGEMKQIEEDIKDVASPLFKEQREFIDANKDYLGVSSDSHLGLLFRSIDFDLGPDERVKFSSQVVQTDIKGEGKGENESKQGERGSVTPTAETVPPFSVKKNGEASKNGLTKSHQQAAHGTDLESLATLVLTQHALYLFPPAMKVEEKTFLVYNIYERFILQDLVMISRPYRKMRSEDGDDYAIRSDDVVLHWKTKKHTWIRPPKGKGPELVEVISHQFYELTGIRLAIQSMDGGKLMDMIIDKSIQNEMDDVLIEFWGLHELVMQGWLWHFCYHRNRGEEPFKKIPKKPKWKREWFSLSSDNSLLRFKSPEEMAGFRAQAASLNLLPVSQKQSLRKTFNKCRIDLMDVDIRNMPILQDPGGFEIMVDTQWHFGRVDSPITHHLFLPLSQAEIGRSRRTSAIRKIFPSIDVFRNRSRSTAASPSKNSWIHSVFKRVQIAQYGLKRAKEQAKAYSSNFYIRTKRALPDKPQPQTPPPDGSMPQITSYDLSKPGSYVLMRVAVPMGKGYTEGGKIMFLTPEDKRMLVTIPPGVTEGEEFVVKVPKMAVMVSEGTTEKKNDGTEKNDDDDRVNNDPGSPDEEPIRLQLDDFLNSDDEDDAVDPAKGVDDLDSSVAVKNETKEEDISREVPK